MNDGRRMKDIMTPEAIDHLRRVFGSGEDMAPGGIIPVTKDVELEAGEMIVPLEVEREKFMQLLREKERQHEARRAAIIGTGRRNGPGTEQIIVATACAAGYDPYDDAVREAIQRITEYVREAAAAATEALQKVCDLLGYGVGCIASTMEEIAKLMEEYDPGDDPQEEDRHDGATMILTIWLPPVPSLKKLYGQGVDYGGLARPSGADPPRR